MSVALARFLINPEHGRLVMYRQGDILIMPVPEASVPPGLVAEPRDPKGRIVLALGEATGHAHALHGPGTLYRGYLPPARGRAAGPRGACDDPAAQGVVQDRPPA